MKNLYHKCVLLLSYLVVMPSLEGVDIATRNELVTLYELYRQTPSDINQHLGTLRQLARECSSVIEIGLWNQSTTWALFLGLTENKSAHSLSYVEIEMRSPPLEKVYLTQRIAHDCDIAYRYLQGNDMSVNLEESADMLFIDSIHTYCHLLYELEKFSPKAKKYIVLHDTNAPWGFDDDSEYRGDYSEYPARYDRTKKGLLKAVDDFLTTHPGWFLKERYLNNHGLTILARKEVPQVVENPEVHVFLHACTIGCWQEVLNRQLSRMKASGLYDACASISVGVLGGGDLSPFQQMYPKLQILFQDSNTGLYERPTLLSLHKFCGAHQNNAVVLYLHTKGVTRDTQMVIDWTKYLEYFVIDRWTDCVEALKNHDVCGANWRLGPYPHFSGNFWWATAAYISNLPGIIGEQYLDPEMWLCQNSPFHKCLHTSHVEHYFETYPESRYVIPLEKAISSHGQER